MILVRKYLLDLFLIKGCFCSFVNLFTFSNKPKQYFFKFANDIKPIKKM